MSWSVTEPTEVPGIVLEVLHNLQKFRVLYRRSYRSLCKKSGLLETLYRTNNRYSVFFYRSTIPRVRVNSREIPSSIAEVFGGSAAVLEELMIFSLGRLLVLLWGTYRVYNGTAGCVCVCVCVCVYLLNCT